MPECPPWWTVHKLGDVLAELPNGKRIHQGWSPQCLREPAPPGEWGVLKTTAIQAGEFLPEHNKALPDHLDPRPELTVQEGDLLLTCAGPRSRCGIPCLVRRTPPRLMMSGKMYRFRPRPDLALAEFLEAQLQAKPWQDAIDDMKTGISESGLNLTHSRFRALRVYLPPLAEQRSIVGRIALLCSSLDAAVADLERAKARLAQARSATLKAAVEGRLVPTEAELARAEGRDYEHASVLLARIIEERRARHEAEQAGAKLKKKYQEPVAPEVEGLPELPEGWVWASMEAIAEVVGGITKNQKLVDGREVPYLRVANVQRGYLDLDEVKTVIAPEEKIEALRLRPGDVLLNEGGDRDKLGRGWVWAGELPECIHQNHVFRARLHLGAFDSRYLSHYANTQGQTYFMDKGTQTTNLASISLSKVRALPVALSPGREIDRILQELDRRLSILSALEATIDTNLARCARLRQAILKAAFEGRLVSSDDVSAETSGPDSGAVHAGAGAAGEGGR